MKNTNERTLEASPALFDQTDTSGNYTLSHWVIVDRNFQRAMRLDKDQSSNQAIDGYVVQGTAKNALMTMATHILGSNQRAFTWTGPYGCGKSSLALVLSSLVGTGELQKRVQTILKLDENDPIASAFNCTAGWHQLLMVGRQHSLTKDLASKLNVDADGRAVTKALEQIAKQQKEGFLFIIDELGKYLEADCASENAYLLQEIAETANRYPGRFIFVGILHQAVDVYASKLPRNVRDEWSKVQGRFVDIPLLSSSEETIELLGHSFDHTNGNPPIPTFFTHLVKDVAHAFALKRPEMEDRISGLLMSCWPLHPVTTLLLGPISRRKFSQNERSIYSFLSASEPLGFRNFTELNTTAVTYEPADYWDYLKENFEASILTTSDSHRWLTAVEAISRAERTCDPLAIRLAKSIAIIDLFRNGSGIEATREILAASINATEKELETVLGQLIANKVIIERRFANSFAVFAGSDFDLDAALKTALANMGSVDTVVLERFLTQTPIVAREYYLRMGTMYWFNRHILLASELSTFLSAKRKPDGSVGTFVLLLPNSVDEEFDEDRLRTIYASNGLSHSDERHYILGYPRNGRRILELLEELQALSIVSKDPLLEGDETGRAEVRVRTNFISQKIQDEIALSYAGSVWYSGGEKARQINKTQELVQFATTICDSIFNQSPELNNESLNRDHLSTQNSSARRELMNHMVLNRHDENLGFEGFPPAYAFYLSLLKDLHVFKDNHYDFELDLSENSTFCYLWQATEHYLKTHNLSSAKDICAFWAKPPFGLKAGPMPILLLAFYLARQDNLAVYLGGAFQSSFTTATVDEWLVDPSRIAFRWVETAKSHENYLNDLAERLGTMTTLKVQSTPLGIARVIVAIILKAPQWALRSTSYTPNTLKLKTAAQKASDPIQFLFRDIPAIYEQPIDKALAKCVTDSLEEFVKAMPGMIGKVREVLFTALQADPSDLESLHRRAANVRKLSGDVAFDGFVARLERFQDHQSDIEGLISLATSRPSSMWTDREIEAAKTKLADLAYRFRQLEGKASLRGRDSLRRVFTVTFAGKESDLQMPVEVDIKDQTVIDEKASLVKEHLKGLPINIALAILSEAGINLVNDQKNE